MMPTMKLSEAYRDALAIQRLVAKDAKDPELVAKDRCLLARAFVELETLKLRLRGKGPPKAVDMEKRMQRAGMSRGGMA